MPDMVALILLTIGGISQGLIDMFQSDIVTWTSQGQAEIINRTVYILVGLAGVWCISLLSYDSKVTSRRK